MGNEKSPTFGTTAETETNPPTLFSDPWKKMYSSTIMSGGNKEEMTTSPSSKTYQI